ncbi:MAG: hypothetical protein J0L75_14855 [Spirochaetes bacterium]|nr:hypothetical protein [Spirochaetota bacterium]
MNYPRVWISLFLSISTGALHPIHSAPIRVGVIRWGAWTSNFLQSEYLAATNWHGRLPYFAIRTNGKVIIDECQQGVMDQDLLYASSAGIDYWAVNFRFWPRDLRRDPTWKWYTPDLPALHRRSVYRNRVKYCLFLQDHLLGPNRGADPNWDYRAEWRKIVDEIVAMFREDIYQKVMENRPLLYVLGAEKFGYFISPAEMKDGFELLSAQCEAIGLGKPYVTGMLWLQGGERSRFKNEAGFDAVSGYGAPIHPEIRLNPGQKIFNNFPYSKLAEANAAFWDYFGRAGFQIIPPLNEGWDSRPAQVKKFPLYDRPEEGPWFARGTDEELSENVRAACQWVIEHPESCETNSILIYNWSEYVEGGFLCPTRDAGSSRLDAVKRALARFK